MKLYPLKEFIVTSPHSPAALAERLSNEITSVSDGLFKRQPKTFFKGYATPVKFEISRVPEGRNSFIPQITGLINPYLSRSEIKIRMRLNLLVFGFICFWLGFVSLGFFIELVQSIIDRHFDASILIFVIMFIFGHGLMSTLFKSECETAMEKVLKVSEGDLKR